MTTTLTRPGAGEVAESPAGTRTVASRIRDRAHTMGGRVAMREKDFGIWKEITWESYWDTALTVGHALLALGVEPGDRVAIHADNRPEWLYSDVAIVAIRAMSVGLYPTNPSPEVQYVLAHSGSKVLIAEDQEQVDKALAVIDDCPDLERIVYIEPRGIRYHYAHPKLISWEDMLKLGAEHRAAHPGAVEARMATATPDDIATLVYTSGTTGAPKGAMLSVANIEFCIRTLVEDGGFASPPANPRDVTLSYLPLCHIAERIFTVYQNAAGGVQAHFGESIATVQADLREVQPTLLFGVPRIWERILAGVSIGLINASPLKRLNSRVWLAASGWIGDTLVRRGGRHSLLTRLIYAIGWVFFYRALRERIGVSKVRFATSGAAPIAPEVLKFYMGIGVPMFELYGMTENAAVATANRPGRIKLGTVGEPHPAIELRLDEETGEILTRHPAVFVGYYRDPEATARAKTPDGWLHTGDIGEWVEGTHIRLTDRAKDIIITSGGKNVAPSEIENALKASPYIKEVIVIGDRHPYLVALIGIELETVGDWAQRKGITYTTYRDLAERPEVRELVEGIVADINTRFNSVEQIKKFRMLPKELDHEDGELTATQKVKRAAIARVFDDLIEDMYDAGGTR